MRERTVGDPDGDFTQVDEAAEEYLLHLTVERGLSAATVASYRGDLRAYARFLNGRGVVAPSSVTAEHVRRFMQARLSSGVSPRSVARNLSCLRGFHRYLVGSGLVPADPTSDVEGPRFERRLPDVLAVHEIETLLGAVDTSTPLGVRDRAMLELAYAAGLRVSEIIGLPLSNLFFEDGFVRCMGKGSRERVVPVGASAIDWTNLYRSDVRPELVDRRAPTDVLFLNA
ncbi:MAG: site-specific integrase, partial [Candidatus Eisenbacteria bacterium]|nr:site-specific integrase [Candidatus Eisenbacteria bacterium]